MTYSPKTKTFKQLTAEHAAELRSFSDSLVNILEDQKTIKGLQKHAVLASMAGYLQGAADAIQSWPFYFTEKK